MRVELIDVIIVICFMLGLIGSILLNFISFFGLPMFLLGMVPVLLLWKRVDKLENQK